jgi:hypothetical protein
MASREAFEFCETIEPITDYLQLSLSSDRLLEAKDFVDNEGKLKVVERYETDLARVVRAEVVQDPLTNKFSILYYFTNGNTFLRNVPVLVNSQGQLWVMKPLVGMEFTLAKNDAYVKFLEKCQKI